MTEKKPAVDENIRPNSPAERLTSDEDRLAKWIIERDDPRDYDVEVHYNHYGDRGIVDLVIEGDAPADEKSPLYVWELKSDAAIDYATGANEIIRQFKRQRKYFIKGTDYNGADYTKVRHYLGFFATEKALRHIENNRSLYESLAVGPAANNVQLLHPGIRAPGLPLVENIHGEEPFAQYRFYKHVLEGGSVDE